MSECTFTAIVGFGNSATHFRRVSQLDCLAATGEVFWGLLKAIPILGWIVTLILIAIHACLARPIAFGQPPPNWPKRFTYVREPIFATREVERSYRGMPRVMHYARSELIKEKRVHPDLELRTLTAPHPLASRRTVAGHRQLGVFATKILPAWTLLGEFVGEVRLEEGRPSGSDYAWSADGFVMDAERYANELAFVNDHRGILGVPNTRSGWEVEQGQFFYCYFTTREVAAGEELVTHYGSQYFEARKSGNL